MGYLDKQIKRLKKDREQNPYINMAQEKLRAFAPEFRDLQRGLDTSLRRGDMTVGAKLQATQSLADTYKGAVGDVYGKAESQNQVRLDQINREIDNLELRKDIEAEEKAKRKKALENQKKEMLYKVGGTLLGAGVGFATGGVPGAMAGAKFGSGAGNFAASNVGEFDINQAYEGLTDTLSGIGDVATLKLDKDLSKELLNFTEQTKGWSFDKLSGVLQQLKIMNARQALKFLQGMDYEIPTQQSINQMPNYMGY